MTAWRTRNRDDVAICDSCGRFFTTGDGAVGAFIGHGELIDFCTRACMYECFRRGAVLIGGRVVLALFGKTPAEHLADLSQSPSGEADQ